MFPWIPETKIIDRFLVICSLHALLPLMLHIIFILVFEQAVVIYTKQMVEQTFVNSRVSNQNLEMERGRLQAHAKPRERKLGTGTERRGISVCDTQEAKPMGKTKNCRNEMNGEEILLTRK